ncbi:MAG: hypothetical protein HY064_12770 [Bacteroidetes bacterium]|nr:hypothetical protein [Bacteroidota bacterium]
MRKILIIFLAVPALLCGKVIPLSPANCNHVKDSLIIRYYIDSLNETFAPDDKAAYTDGRFDYAPGNYFKILSLSGQKCGMQCNPLDESFVFYENEKGLHIKELGMNPVTSITELNSDEDGVHEFIVMASTWYVMGPAGGDEKDFCYMLATDSVYADTIRMLNPKQNANWFGVTTENVCDDFVSVHHLKDDFPVLIFDPLKNEIVYKYLVYMDGNGKCYEVWGSFSLRSGHFTQVGEKNNMPQN